MPDFNERLTEYLRRNRRNEGFEQLTPDASTREYFRIVWDGRSAIACVYPEPFVAAEQTYLDVTRLFEANGLPVAQIYNFDESLGVIVQEDLGNTILRDVLEKSSPERRESLVTDAIGLIARIQSATESAYNTGSITGRLKFDVEKLLWELNFFREHYFETLRKKSLSARENAALDEEFLSLCEELESYATVLCHRDFHAANLMVDGYGRLRIIDHQDARIGSPAYDLVSLLLDRITELPSEGWLASKRALLLADRSSFGLPEIDDQRFAYEFDVQSVQRCLKAVGTFSFQSVNRGKTYFIPFIKPMFRVVDRACDRLGKYSQLRQILKNETV
jgi:aminoglycoside/choline kinase family phosphotransferase